MKIYNLLLRYMNTIYIIESIMDCLSRIHW